MYLKKVTSLCLFAVDCTKEWKSKYNSGSTLYSGRSLPSTESLSQAVSFKEASGQKAGTATPNSDHTVKSCVLKCYV